MSELMSLLSPRFPPAALALVQLAEAEDVTEAECACLVQCLWGLMREMVPSHVPDNLVLENSRTFLSWLLAHARDARDTATKQRSKELAIKRLSNPTGGRSTSSAATGTEAASIGEKTRAFAGATVESVSVLCCRLMERLEGGHAVRIRVDGNFLKGVYSRGGAQQKREELLLLESDASAAGGRGGGGGGGGGIGDRGDGIG
ncbi:unnamed protein product, partial [Ectocarpus sp. 12 AP-2014]